MLSEDTDVTSMSNDIKIQYGLEDRLDDYVCRKMTQVVNSAKYPEGKVNKELLYALLKTTEAGDNPELLSNFHESGMVTWMQSRFNRQ